jgi:hypothetical protein
MSVSEFAKVNCLLNPSREQILSSGVAAEFVFSAPEGSVFALDGIDGAGLRALLDQVDLEPDVIELLADTALRRRDRPPSSTAATTRSRRSREYGRPIHAGLLPSQQVESETS